MINCTYEINNTEITKSFNTNQEFLLFYADNRDSIDFTNTYIYDDHDNIISYILGKPDIESFHDMRQVLGTIGEWLDNLNKILDWGR